MRPTGPPSLLSGSYPSMDVCHNTTHEGHTGFPYWAAQRQRVEKPFKRRRILPAYQELLDAGAFRGGTDSTQVIREDRDSR